MTNRALRVFIVVGSLLLIAAGVGLYVAGVFERAPELTPVPPLEVRSTDPAVAEQIRTAHAQLAANPYDPNVNGRLGVLCEIYQYPETARICYERAAALAPLDFRWKYYQARIEQLLGNPEATVSLLNSALALNDRYTPAVALLGDAYLELGQVDDAEEAYRRALAFSQRSCSALLGLGKALARKGDHAGAIEQYERGLLAAPQHAPLHYALGLSYRAVGDTARAEEHLETARQGAPANPDFDPLVADIYEQEIGVNSTYKKAIRRLNARQFDEAIVMLREVVEQDPDHFGARGALGKALSLTDRSDEALVEYEKAVALNPTNIDFLRPYALLLYRAKRVDEAEAALRKVLELGGDHADDHHVLGAILLRRQSPEEAMVHFELAVERRPDHAEARGALLQVLRGLASRAASDAEAVPYLRRMTEVEPRDLLSWTKLAGALEGAGDLRGALDALDKALAINPNLAQVVEKRDLIRDRIERGEG